MKRAIIYVAGLGDYRSRSQRLAVRWWRLYGIRSEVVLMQWLVDEPFETKQARLLDRIDALSTSGYQVSLVGVSAGASAVVNTLAVRQTVIHRVVCICGKLRNPQTISSRTYQRNPAFAESLQMLPASLVQISADKKRDILSIRPLADGSVSPQDTIIEGCQDRTIPTVGHVLSIGLTITVFSWLVVRFIKH